MANDRKAVGGGVYNKDGVTSVGGHIGPVGAAIGIDKGKPFGSANINGKKIGSFGPQDKDEDLKNAAKAVKSMSKEDKMKKIKQAQDLKK